MDSAFVDARKKYMENQEQSLQKLKSRRNKLRNPHEISTKIANSEKDNEEKVSLQNIGK